MRIYLAGTELTGSSMREWPNNLTLNGERLTQLMARLRATKIKSKSRDNKKSTVNFTVTREHNSIPECQAFMFKHFAGLPGEGTARFHMIDPAGPSSSLYMPDSTLDASSGIHKGRSSIFTYTIVGGHPQVENPDLPDA